MKIIFLLFIVLSSSLSAEVYVSEKLMFTKKHPNPRYSSRRKLKLKVTHFRPMPEVRLRFGDNIRDKSNFSIQKIAWDPVNSHTLYSLDSRGKLFGWNTKTAQKKLIFEIPANYLGEMTFYDYSVEEGKITLYNGDKNEVITFPIQSHEGAEERQVVPLPKEDNWIQQFRAIPGKNEIVILTKSRLYHYSLSSKRLKKIMSFENILDYGRWGSRNKFFMEKKGKFVSIVDGNNGVKTYHFDEENLGERLWEWKSGESGNQFQIFNNLGWKVILADSNVSSYFWVMRDLKTGDYLQNRELEYDFTVQPKVIGVRLKDQETISQYGAYVFIGNKTLIFKKFGTIKAMISPDQTQVAFHQYSYKNHEDQISVINLKDLEGEGVRELAFEKLGGLSLAEKFVEQVKTATKKTIFPEDQRDIGLRLLSRFYLKEVKRVQLVEKKKTFSSRPRKRRRYRKEVTYFIVKFIMKDDSVISLDMKNLITSYDKKYINNEGKRGTYKVFARNHGEGLIPPSENDMSEKHWEVADRILGNMEFKIEIIRRPVKLEKKKHGGKMVDVATFEADFRKKYDKSHEYFGELFKRLSK